MGSASGNAAASVAVRQIGRPHGTGDAGGAWASGPASPTQRRNDDRRRGMQALAQQHRKHQGAIAQVASRQPPRLLAEPIQPLEARVLNP